MQTALLVTVIYDVLTVIIIYGVLRWIRGNVPVWQRVFCGGAALLLATSLYWFTCCDYNGMYISYITYAMCHFGTINTPGSRGCGHR